MDTDSGSVSEGSNPSPAAPETPVSTGVLGHKRAIAAYVAHVRGAVDRDQRRGP